MGVSFRKVMSSKPVMAAVTGFATFCLMVAFIAAGLFACLAPVTTQKLADATVTDRISPFSHEQLVDTALAVRDYSFGTGNAELLYNTVRRINVELLSQSSTRLPGAPSLEALNNARGVDQIKQAFSQADDRYVLDADAVSHLDDVFIVGQIATIAAFVLMLLGLAALLHLVYYRNIRALSTPLIASGSILIAVFAVLGIWAVVDFYGLFTAFHSLFFSEGTWTFSYNSLLICSLPTEFWMGMAFIWLGVTCALSIVSIVIGMLLRNRKKRN